MIDLQQQSVPLHQPSLHRPTLDEPGYDSAREPEPEPRVIRLLDVMLAMAHGKRVIALFTLAALLLSAAYAFFLKPVYESHTVMLTPQQPSSAFSILAGAMSSLGAGGSGLSQGPSDPWIGILRSRTVGEDVVKRLDLQKTYNVQRMSFAVGILEGQTQISAGKDGLITISVRSRDPKLAAAIANAFVQALFEENQLLAVTEAAQRRLFFERQLSEEKDALADSEVALKQTQQKTGVIELGSQEQTTIRSIADLQAQITGREASLEALRAGATEQNPEVIRQQTELSALRGELSRMQSTSGASKPGDISLSATKVPEAGLEYIRRARDVRYHETLFDILARQYEAAKIDESKAAPLLQVLDPAISPDLPVGPRRKLIVAACTLIGFFLGCLWVLFHAGLRRLHQDPDQSVKLKELRRALALR